MVITPGRKPIQILFLSLLMLRGSVLKSLGLCFCFPRAKHLNYTMMGKAQQGWNLCQKPLKPALKPVVINCSTMAHFSHFLLTLLVNLFGILKHESQYIIQSGAIQRIQHIIGSAAIYSWCSTPSNSSTPVDSRYQCANPIYLRTAREEMDSGTMRSVQFPPLTIFSSKVLVSKLLHIRLD